MNLTNGAGLAGRPKASTFETKEALFCFKKHPALGHDELRPARPFFGDLRAFSLVIISPKAIRTAAAASLGDLVKEYETDLQGRKHVHDSVTRVRRMREVAAMLKAVHAQEDLQAARDKAVLIVAKLREMKLAGAAEIVATGVEETLQYFHFPSEHWRSLCTNNPLERLMREIRRRTRAVGAFPDGNSALILVSPRLRHVVGTQWGRKRYMDMNRLNGLPIPHPPPTRSLRRTSHETPLPGPSPPSSADPARSARAPRLAGRPSNLPGPMSATKRS